MITEENRSIVNSITDQWNYEHKKFQIKNNMKEIRTIARIIAQKWDHMFEEDELVNEAWIRCKDTPFSTLSKLKTAARCDMIDYIRTIVGRKGNGRRYPSGTLIKDVIKSTARLRSNTISKITEDNKINPFENSYIDNRFKQIDDQDFINYIFKHININEIETRIIKKRLMHSIYASQIERETGIATSTVNYYLRKNLRILQDYIKKYDKEMVS